MHISTIWTLFLAAGSVSASFHKSSKSNLAVYWGQDSANKATSQDRLSIYCQNSDVDIIILSFLTQINGSGGAPVLNLANQIDKKKGCEVFPGTYLWKCPEIATDIKDSQNKYGKTILLSIGGATYNEAFASKNDAVEAARKVWHTFGPPDENKISKAPRPFGDVTVDGFDFDFEAVVNNAAPFTSELRRITSCHTNRTKQPFYLSAAPQCPFPDSFNKDILDSVGLDFLVIQFYNNYCGVNSFVAGKDTQQSFNLDVLDQWARTQAMNKNIRLLVGVPGNTGAGSGYVNANALAHIIDYSRKFEEFGGVMMWDASQAWTNGKFVGDVKA